MRTVSSFIRLTSGRAGTGLLALAVVAFAPASLLAQDSVPPTLSSLSFSPNAINVAAADQTVTVNWSAADNVGVFYIEVGFVDSSGSNFRRGCASAGGVVPGCSSFAAGTSVTSSLPVVFQQFSPGGAWTVGYALLFDTSFNLNFLGPLGFAPLPSNPGTLQVNTTEDSMNPTMAAFTLSSNSIDTTAAPVSVNMNFTLSDDVSGASKWQITFTSPSKLNSVSTTVNVLADCPAGLITSCTAPITFPRFSEPGVWTITNCIISDVAGNTLVWATADMTSHGFATTITLASTPDTTAPALTANLTLSPGTINVVNSSVNVSVGFSASDPAPNASGVTGFAVGLIGPSGNFSLGGSSSFPANTTVTGSAIVTVPLGSEVGNWRVAFVQLVDAAGNSATLTTSPAGNFPVLVVTANPVDSTPPTITPIVTPLPNGAGWNNSTPVTVSWNVADPESTITSSSGCGTTTYTSPTTGTVVTCSATSAGGTNSVNVVVKIDTAAPVTSNVNAVPNPLAVGDQLTITATVTDPGGSGVASAEYQVDGGPFDDLVATDGTFGGATEGVTLTLPGTHPLLVQPGVHDICVRGTDVADNIGAVECVVIAVHSLTSFTSGGGGTNSPAGADLVQPSGSGPVTYGFNVKQLPGDVVPSGNFEFHYKAGAIDFKEDSFDFQVLSNGNHAQIQGTGTLNGTTSCKFAIDAYAASFPPNNVDAFGLRIFNCGGGSGDRYNLPATAVTKGNIVIHP